MQLKLLKQKEKFLYYKVNIKSYINGSANKQKVLFNYFFELI